MQERPQQLDIVQIVVRHHHHNGLLSQPQSIAHLFRPAQHHFVSMRETLDR
jgi:hypothetical protein